MSSFNIIVENQEYTVVSKYEKTVNTSDAYQSEADLEKEFIHLLTEQGYDYLPIHCEADLISNLRSQLEKLNNYHFTDSEWERFFSESLANKNDDIVSKASKIQENYILNLRRDTGETKNIYLIDKKHIHNNSLQVINQYEEDGGNHDTRYDVTILVNGLPLVHVELKRRGVLLKEAFNQIERYQRDSFWAGCGLYEYIQIFIISNGTYTKYYSNTTRFNHIKEQDAAGRKKSKKTSNSYEFTSYWADAGNKLINDLLDFAKTFLSKHTILNILTKYCVFTSEKMLLVMRPYQIAATERIIQKINVANNYKLYGSTKGGGYIWHTTGSGKTLTSFKTAQLATSLDCVDKVLFVVDRADLDYQTMKEYDRFEKGCANGNSSTAVLQRQLENPSVKIIVTTIQKLSIFVNRNPGHPVFQQKIAIIFDECHRSNFGDMHAAIVKNFKKYYLFGFTGTPIFAANASTSGKPDLKTTEQAFGDKLHTYTIVDAINDGNVLPFKIDFVNTFKGREDIADLKVAAIDRENAMAAPERIEAIVRYILDHFNSKTQRGSFYKFHGNMVDGFNALFAVSSIPVAQKYYNEFKRQQAELPVSQRLKIATIFSYAANEEERDGILVDENTENTTSLDQVSRDFLEGAIADYNEMFSVNYDTSSDRFQNYYKDLSERMKKRQVDLVIVVNMFLTGFDATTLNTLFVDKNLRQHGLIQAFSRTNRILNSVKTFGNIVCFRDLQEATDEAIALFGDKDAQSIVLLKDYASYYDGYTDEEGKHHAGYVEIVERLENEFPVDEEPLGENAERKFITLYGSLLRSMNVLSTFDQFKDAPKMPERMFADYMSRYLELKDKWRRNEKGQKENINDDLVFETELIRQIDINIDYILALVKKYHDENCVNKEILVDISKAVGASMQLRSKKELIESFVASVNVDTDIDVAWKEFVEAQKAADLQEIIDSEGLRPYETNVFIENAFRDGAIRTTGTDIDKILPPMSRFGGLSSSKATYGGRPAGVWKSEPNGGAVEAGGAGIGAVVGGSAGSGVGGGSAVSGDRTEKKRRIIERLQAFFDKYFGV